MTASMDEEAPTMESMRWVGVDVHAKETVAAVLEPATSDVSTQRITGRPREAARAGAGGDRRDVGVGTHHRQAKVLAWNRHAIGARACGRSGGLSSFSTPAVSGQLPGSGAERALLRREAPPRRNHRGWFQARSASARRGGLAVSPSTAYEKRAHRMARAVAMGNHRLGGRARRYRRRACDAIMVMRSPVLE
jgi:hypothetical protein